jgi:hypothetical protein
MNSRPFLVALAIAGALLCMPAARATGLATCDSGGREGWQAQEKLTAVLKEKGWQVRRIKEDGGCYEVYALNEKGERVEAYFHPRTLAPVPTGAKGHKG